MLTPLHLGCSYADQRLLQHTSKNSPPPLQFVGPQQNTPVAFANGHLLKSLTIIISISHKGPPDYLFHHARLIHRGPMSLGVVHVVKANPWKKIFFCDSCAALSELTLERGEQEKTHGS